MLEEPSSDAEEDAYEMEQIAVNATVQKPGVCSHIMKQCLLPS